MSTGSQTGAPDLRDDVEQMRRSFDQVFAAPDPPPAGERDDFVAVRVGGRPFALRVAELVRIEAGRKIVALPGGDPWLLGLAACQGKLIPVYSLELALGDRTTGENTWLGICGREDPLGLAFGALEGYFRVPRADVYGPGEAGSQQNDAHRSVSIGGALRTVVHLPSVLAAIRERVTAHTSTEPEGASR
ncbi:chemotaxis protein : Putative chemotaxis signal transduction protein CheW OS=Actinoplanes friuliensis DSM 7358 GN=AFR_25675 PE=4 SV=1: CheW [Gemmata massiliana]|uniref:CheW-like domain-containing protein n=1 Tax=Gemmata massiliana TaxID=1210884 RepID=A0A6P2CUB4_9BACT|nr:chemotaxis protein CheW [Gemmata massiliana]VTR92559.1 chemotaxis protein : Putative chemotaxis signal transduction protein CheW OS=Actinoplanes friuliensis DSM 7358 GN=AFR_25675 PE=4 SV=1: CheW [Gemmata massiliana]